MMDDVYLYKTLLLLRFVIGKLLSTFQEVDIAALSYVANAERLKLMEFSPAIGTGQYRFLTPLPGDESRVWAVIKPFQPMVGICGLWKDLTLTWLAREVAIRR